MVIQAGAIGRAGEALVLDMGAPVRIAEVAQRMAAQAERPTHVVYTGLRTGEKLHEVLLGAREADERPIHPAISHVAVPSLDPLDVRTLDPWVPTSELIETMRYLCVDEVVPAAASSTWRYGWDEVGRGSSLMAQVTLRLLARPSTLHQWSRR